MTRLEKLGYGLLAIGSVCLGIATVARIMTIETEHNPHEDALLAGGLKEMIHEVVADGHPRSIAEDQRTRSEDQEWEDDFKQLDPNRSV